MPKPDDDNIKRGNADGDGRGAVESLVEEVLRYLASDTTPQAVVALGERLRNEPGAPDLFVRLCLLDSRLCEKFAPGRREFMSEMILDESEDRRGASSVDAMVMPAITSCADDEPEIEPITLPSWPAPAPPAVAWWRRPATWVIA